MRGSKIVFPTLVVGALSAGAFGSNWMERPTASPPFSNHSGTSSVSFGDAGESLAEANLTLGVGSLDFITGQMVGKQRPQTAGGNLRSLDADMFCIRITDPVNFAAIASGTDTVLALFDAAGVAVAFNDNRTDSATSTGSRLIANGFLADGTTPTGISGLTAGLYYLGISRNDGSATARRFSRPLDSAGNLIFQGMTQNGNESTDPNFPTRRQDQSPITPGTALASWELFSTTALPFNANYTIALTGVGYHDIPAPSACAVLGLAGLAGLRRRR